MSEAFALGFWEARFNPSPHDAHMRVLAHVPAGARVLDVGCNTGELAEQMKRRLGCRVVGVEVQPAAAEIARSRLDEVILCDASELTAVYPPSGDFDCVVASDVLEHLQQPLDVARALVQYLKPGGQMIVTLPNVANWAVRLELLGGHFDYESCASILSSGHLRFFTLRTAKRLLEDAGLDVVAVDVTPRLFVLAPYHLTVERVFGRWRWYRHFEYTLSRAWKGPLAYQFVLVGRVGAHR